MEVAPGDTVFFEVENLRFFQADAAFKTPDGDPVDTSGWSFAVNGQVLVRVQRDGEALSYSLQVTDDHCDQVVTSPQIDPNVRIPLRCGDSCSQMRPLPAPDSVSTFDADVECRYRPHDDVAVLCFDQQGSLYRPPLLREHQDYDDLDDNDKIKIYLLVPRTDAQKFIVDVQGTINDDPVRVQGVGSIGQIRDLRAQLQSTTGEPLMLVFAGSYGPFSAPAFTVTVRHRQDADTVTDLRSTPFSVNPTYIAGLRFAVGQSSIRFNDYQLRTFADEEGMRIKNTASEDDQREFLNIVFYGWPWQERLWKGRDIRKTPTLAERFNPLVGVGLDELGDEYLVGVSIEATRALDLFVARHYAKVQVLDGGFEEGDEFPGEAASLPTEEDWEEDWVVGVSIDLRVAGQVLGSLFASAGGS